MTTPKTPAPPQDALREARKLLDFARGYGEASRNEVTTKTAMHYLRERLCDAAKEYEAAAPAQGGVIPMPDETKSADTKPAHKHQCTRCNGEFDCWSPGVCRAGYRVSPLVVLADGSTSYHCPPVPPPENAIARVSPEPPGVVAVEFLCDNVTVAAQGLRMTPTRARAMAHGLLIAADAVDATERALAGAPEGQPPATTSEAPLDALRELVDAIKNPAVYIEGLLTATRQLRTAIEKADAMLSAPPRKAPQEELK